MASIVSAGTTSATALNMSADTTGILQLASNNGTVALTVSTAQNILIGSTVDNGYKLKIVGGNATNLLIDNGGQQYTQLLLQRNGAANTGGDILIDGTSGSMNIRSLLAGPMVFYTSASAGSPAEGMRISSAGQVTTPYQPSFLAGSTDGDTNVASGSPIPFNSIGTSGFNVGSGYSTSTYLFTAPVAGKYIFNFLGFFTNSAGATQGMQVAPQINGSYVSVGGDVVVMCSVTPNSVGGTICIGGSVVLNLAANDTVGMVSRGTTARFYMGHTKFSGYLLG